MQELQLKRVYRHFKGDYYLVEDVALDSETDETENLILSRSENMLKFICYPKCTTCQKARKWLDENNIEYEFRDIKSENPSLEELTAWYKLSGLPLRKFFNTSGLLYKSMELKTKLPTMTDEEMLALLATDGMLVKRPLASGDDFVLVGFKEAEWAEKLK